MSPGPTNEIGQTLAFVITTDDDGLFAVGPAIDATGKLTFTPQPNASGTAHVTIALKDNGGTAAGGSDTSAAATITITINKLHPWHNTVNACDVTGDMHVAPNDALEVINFINAFGSIQLSAVNAGPPYLDVDNDRFVAPNDALTIINLINAGQGSEGEVGTLALPIQPADEIFRDLGRAPANDANDPIELIAILADDIADATKRRRL
jgi:hypothetical protein